MPKFIDATEFEQRMGPDELDNVPERYREFRDSEGIPIHTGLFAEDMNELETGPWGRTGQKGAFVNLYGAEGVDDMQIHEIAPGEQTTQQHHLYDELVYVSQGQGLTAVGPEDDETIFEWERHAMFIIPPSVPYRHINTSEDASARLISHTPLPQLMNLITDTSLIFEPTEDRSKRYTSDLYAPESELYEESIGRLAWDANFIPNVNTFDKLQYWDKTGALRMVVFPMKPASTYAHIGELPVGKYKTAHRHSPGANIAILGGEGYSLMWREGWDELVEIEWGPNSLFTPPARWYHQHFNTSSKPARTLAFHCPRLGRLNMNPTFAPQEPENIIEYTEEDPAILEKFERSLKEKGRSHSMPEEAYTNPDFEWTDDMEYQWEQEG